MKTEINTIQKLTIQKTISFSVLGFFVGFGLYHFVKVVSTLF